MTNVAELDKHLTDVEALVTDFPEMINLRFETLAAAQSEMTARMNLLDRQLATLTRDVRDMRAAVTRQLLGQDDRFSAIEERLAGLDARLAGLEQRFDKEEQRLTSLETKLDQVLTLLSSRA